MKFNLPKSKKLKYQSFVLKSGKLRPDLRPAIFCDTSFLLDYWNSSIHNSEFDQFPFNKVDPIDATFLEYLKSDVRTKKIYEVRRKIENFSNKKTLVFSPACRLELEEVLSALRFKKYGVEVTENSIITKKKNKEIGDILLKIKKDFEINEKESIQNNLQLLFHHFFFTTDRIEEGLLGILEVDIINFQLTKKDHRNLIYLANLQVGFADIFHIISASRLGCNYLFTLDSDFQRISNEVKKLYNIEIVTDPKKMLEIV